ncbi:DUF4194 domain-containing protein [Comamonas thiooxydans]|uniref:DUF4194 domain-containing protein n=1 Tax=Comamonas thiooxydans TaxID=363952 RepID=UPI000B411CE7|nr:DUF4194 domain-containing protein [Comamonas thiooxydans]
MSTTCNLFPGDRGEMSLDTRRVFVNLLRGPLIDGQRQPNLWMILLRDEALIRSRLSEMFLTLVLDVDQTIAFTQQAETEGIDSPTLLRKATLSFRESALLLHLRAELAVADAQGERCVVDREKVIDHLRGYMAADDNDSVKYDRQSEAAIEKLSKLSLLHKLKGSDTRMEVSQALRLMFSITEIEALASAYEAMRSGDTESTQNVDQGELALDESEPSDAVASTQAATAAEPAAPDMQPVVVAPAPVEPESVV